MRIMAVDYGDARIGISVSDESMTLPGDSWVIKNTSVQGTASVIIEEATRRSVKRIIVGHPINMNGTIGSMAEKSELFTESLRMLSDIEVILWDERLTTQSAHRILAGAGRYGKKRKNTVDAVAASLILESYLTFCKTGNQDC